MMIKCGCDMVHLPHFEARYQHSGERLLQRLFSESERILIQDHVPTMAGFFAVKEAFAKALGIGLWAENALRFSDLTIAKTKEGAPLILWNERVSTLVPQLIFPGNNGKESDSGFTLDSASVSISHDGDYAMAFVVLSLIKKG